MPDVEHPTESTLRARLAGDLPEECRAQFDRHFFNCLSCQKKAAAWSVGQRPAGQDSDSGAVSTSELVRYERLDEVCDRFETQWRQGEEPDLEAFAALVPAEEQPALRCELLLLACQLAQPIGRADEAALPREGPPRSPSSGEPAPVADGGNTRAKPRRRAKPPMLGPYILAEELSRTAATAVHRAVHHENGEVFAIKRLRSRLSLPEVDRLRLETLACQAAKVRHRHLVAMHGMESQGRSLYWVMEYVEGESLARVMKAASLPDGTAANITRQLAEALEHAHAAGLTHGHVRAAKVLIDRCEEPHLLGLGLPRNMPGSSELSATQRFVPPSYLAPEQAQRGGAAGPAADIYALGALLYTMLAGVAPFASAKLPEFFRLLASEPPAPPHQHRPEVDRQLEEICLRCLAKDPCGRYPSAHALAHELQMWLSQRGAPRRAAGLYSRWKANWQAWRQRRRSDRE